MAKAYIISLILAVNFFFGCKYNARGYLKKDVKENNVNYEKLNTCAQVDLALSFMNSYAEFCMVKMGKRDTLTEIQWVKNNANITNNFKHTYDTLITNARKEDPEMGLGVDPIFNAQDFPDSGFVLSKCNNNSQYVELKGKDWPEFKVTVKLIKVDDKWLVDGAGLINIPDLYHLKR